MLETKIQQPFQPLHVTSKFKGLQEIQNFNSPKIPNQFTPYQKAVNKKNIHQPNQPLDYVKIPSPTSGTSLVNLLQILNLIYIRPFLGDTSLTFHHHLG